MVKELSIKDGDYSVVEEGSEDTWWTYTYTIAPQAFMKNGALQEGGYIIAINSTDTENRENSNRTSEAFKMDVNFTIDCTPPSLDIVGIAQGDSMECCGEPSSASTRTGFTPG